MSRYYIVEYKESDGWDMHYGAIVMDREQNTAAKIFTGEKAKEQAEAWVAKNE